MPTSPPIIGITTYGRDKKNNYPLPVEYVAAVRRAGGAALLMPPGETQLEAILARIDGIILAGGGDIDPGLYGGRDHKSIYMVDAERDGMEVALAQVVIDSGLPTFGICRGSQIINVVLGGTLVEHLPDEYGEEVKHRLPPREPVPHPIQVAPDSRLAECLGTTQCDPSSWHHQAIRQVATGLKTVAHAPDGVIEAVELVNHPWLLAVQWHPELTAHEDRSQQRLFDAFVEAARKWRRTCT